MSKRPHPAAREAAAVEAAHEPEDHNLFAKITPLGAGSEVGRSCIVFEYQDRKVMFDCGIHPGFRGMQSLPLLDSVDLAAVDVALITHFHLDHCAAVPYLLCKTKFKGRIFMTHPTKAIYYSLLRDLTKMSKGSTDEQLYNEEDLDATMERIEVVDFYQTIEVNGIKITPYRAGHVLGAAMFLVEVMGMRCLYTGDYSRLPDRHLPAADIPANKPHVVIVESTYGVSRHLPREQREQLFLNTLRSAIAQGGRVLLPVVALGRAQEVLLMLDEYWEAHPELHATPIYQASGMMSKALGVYQTYVASLNADIQSVFHDRNPFKFKHIQTLKNPAHFISDYTGPCVVMATPSGLQSGVSRDFFEAWCEDARSTCIISDFAVQGTLARELLGGPSTVLTRDGRRAPLRMTVHNISFSAHADYDQTSEFLDIVAPPHVVLVHGEPQGMGKLAKALRDNAKAKDLAREVYTPLLEQTVAIVHKPDRSALLQGQLGEKPPQEGAAVRGVLVREGFGQPMQLLHPDDLHQYTKLMKGRVTQRQALVVNRPFSEIRLALEVMFEGCEGSGLVPVVGTPTREQDHEPHQPQQQQEPASVVVGNLVTVTYLPASPSSSGTSGSGGSSAMRPPRVVLEWDGGREGDMLADAVVAVVLQTISEPEGMAAAEAARAAALHSDDPQALLDAELDLTAALMSAQFGPAVVDAAGACVRLQVDHTEVVISHKSGKVVCADASLRSRIERALERLRTAISPASLATERSEL